MIRKFVLAAAIASTVLSGGTAFAAPAPTPHAGASGLMKADTDRNGVVTRDEAMTESKRKFAMRDTDHDGRLTGAEMAHPRGPRADVPPRHGSEGKVREITRAKFEKKMMRRFDRLDANHDGRVESAEIKAHREKMRSQRNGSQGTGADERG